MYKNADTPNPNHGNPDFREQENLKNNKKSMPFGRCYFLKKKKDSDRINLTPGNTG